jgi:hypothetical protein
MPHLNDWLHPYAPSKVESKFYKLEVSSRLQSDVDNECWRCFTCRNLRSRDQEEDDSDSSDSDQETAPSWYWAAVHKSPLARLDAGGKPKLP